MRNFIKENWFKLSVFIIFVAFSIIYCFVFFLPHKQVINGQGNQQDQSLDKKCKDLGLATVQDEEKKYGADFRFIDIQTFFSKTLNTCVQSRVNELDNVFLVRDIAGNFIKSNLEGRAVTDAANYYGKTVSNLFFCDEDGVDNTRLDVVKAHDGYISGLAYKDYLDDFNEGLPRALKTPDKKFTKNDCKRLFDKKIEEIK